MGDLVVRSSDGFVSQAYYNFPVVHHGLLYLFIC